MIDPTFRNINRLFAQSFKVGENDPTRNSFFKYYIPFAEIKDFNALIDNKLFFAQPTKNKQVTYKKLVEIPRNANYTAGNVLEYLYHQKCYRLIGIDLSRQTNPTILQHNDFKGKLEEDDGATMIYIAEMQQKAIWNISLDSLNPTE